MIDQLNELHEGFKEELAAVAEMQQLDQLKTHFLGKKGPMTDILKNLKDVDPSQRKDIGMAANQIKQQMTAAIDVRRDGLHRTRRSSLRD